MNWGSEVIWISDAKAREEQVKNLRQDSNIYISAAKHTKVYIRKNRAGKH